ncbi:MAG: hypothetical protein A2498_11240 [Lentisphaerae bacterium RIFOXYC12_FULL_60_16]|nr:MAG: hypothetical protein A2498_11240 [Lentisphaerae bacterium RIFOXYC12_FULL_60_16]
MRIEDLPKWMSIIPVLVGVVLTFIGIQVFPLFGLRNVLGPIIGLPVGCLIGFAIMARIAKSREQ